MATPFSSFIISFKDSNYSGALHGHIQPGFCEEHRSVPGIICWRYNPWNKNKKKRPCFPVLALPPSLFYLTQPQWLSPFPLSLCGTLQRRFDLRIPAMKLRGLATNFYIHVSVSNLYIPTIGRPILLNNGNASETKANESFDNGVFFDIEAKRTPLIVS